MASPTNASLSFNPATPHLMHIDLNSCFASVEQQANPLLRGKPVVVGAYAAHYGAILAPSVEAKLYGIKTGMSVQEGLALCPFLVVREADPPKYRQVHKAIGELLNDYSPRVISKSIDEFALTLPSGSDPVGLSTEIKSRLRSEIGDYLRVSIGVSTNQILAKLASGLHKPDGFDILDQHNYRDVYGRIKLQDFCGINVRNEARLNRVGIFNPTAFYSAPIQTLKSAFGGVLGRYWHTRLRGYEVDDLQFARRSFGQSYVLPHPMGFTEWRSILAKLIAKAARRLRASGYSASGVHLSLRYGDGSHPPRVGERARVEAGWHASKKFKTLLFDDASLLTATLNLYRNLVTAELAERSVKKVAFSCFGLGEDNDQLSCLVDTIKQKSLVQSLDRLNDKWGEYTITHGSMMGSRDHVRDAIAFGK